MNEQLVERILNCPSLPSMPAVAMQVLQLAQSPDADIAEIGKLITKDPALSSKILKTVNSSFYGRSSHVGTITQALVILGLQSIKTLVLGFSLVTNLKKSEKGKPVDKASFDHINYWRRSVYAATASRVLCGKTGVIQQEEAFLATLLADIGMLVLDQVLGAEYSMIVAMAPQHNMLEQVESESFEMTHAEVGGILTESWKLPPVLTVPVAHHHSPDAVTDPALRKLAALVGLAGRCADVFVDQEASAAIQDVRKACAAFGLSEADTDSLLSEIGIKTREVAQLFEIQIDSSVQYDQILKRANEALIEITLHSQQQATHFAEKASNLAEQNVQLKEAAVTDALTGLGNRQRFDKFLKEAFDAAKDSGGSMSLVLIDLDHFKKVNDTHGHPAGDAVLKNVARMLKTAARASDVACRYGGEEMAIILPATARATAAATAETVRRSISAKPIPIDGDGATLAVTASFGVATFEPGSPFQKPEHLLKAADLALYNAKHAGRNCVKIFSVRPATAAA